MTARRLRGGLLLAALLGFLVAALAPVAGASAAPGDGAEPVVYRITVAGVIGPATARQVLRGVAAAEDARAEALVIELDTPGGLLQSTDQITKGLLNARVPVVVYIAPRGARAASAGVFITYAAHVAAMAPATHLGAATPVAIGGGGEQPRPDPAMLEKVTNDAVANLRAMARRHGRNADWAEDAVRRAASITHEEAVRLNVVDFTADTFADLLRRLDGRTVETDLGPRTMRTAAARVMPVTPDVTERFLQVLSDPNLGFILLNIGILGILVELYNPGAVLPGVVGAIALILGLASFAILQVNVAGLLLIALAVLLFVADLHVPGHGVLTAGGVVAFVFGAVLLTERSAPVFQISLRLIIAVAVALAAFVLFALGAGMRAMRGPVRSGGSRLVGAVGVARSPLSPEGTVHVMGELWSAIAVDGPIDEGTRVRVVGVDGLRVRVSAERGAAP